MVLLGTTAWARPTVVATLHPYANLIEQIVGNRMNVVQLLPSGASPHTFDPTPSQAASIAGASLIVMNGGVDDWARRLVTAAAAGTPLVVVTERLHYQPIQGSDGVGTNPHIWLDPSLMASTVPLLVVALVSVDPQDAATFRTNGATLVRSLTSLDEALRQELAPLHGAPFVPFHDAWPYFARHFGLDLVASIEPTPGREPSPRTIAEAVATIRRVHAKAVFDERQLNPRPAQVVAEAANVPLVTLDPLGNTGQSYQELMRANVKAIAKALGD
jgi:zinc transport system substrate-binding protein